MKEQIKPPEPPCPPDRLPHRERVTQIVQQCPYGKRASVVVDDTPEHRTYYEHELRKYREISILAQGSLGSGMYVFQITKTAVN